MGAHRLPRIDVPKGTSRPPDIRGWKFIPKRVRFPDGRRELTTALLKPSEMHAKYGEYYDGMFDPPRMHIDLNRKMPLVRKWWVFAHLYKQIVADYWIPWMMAEGFAQERPDWRKPKITPRRLMWKREYDYQRWKAGRRPAQISESEGGDAATNGSIPNDANQGSI